MPDRLSVFILCRGALQRVINVRLAQDTQATTALFYHDGDVK